MAELLSLLLLLFDLSCLGFFCCCFVLFCFIFFILLSPCVCIKQILSLGKHKFILQKLRESLETTLSDHQPEVNLYAALSVILRVLHVTLIIDEPYYWYLLLQI